jgi:mono/diheme cytochrome c family protein
VFALALIAVLAVKITIIKWFKGLLNLVPVMGIVVFVLAFVVVGTSAGFFFVRGAVSDGAAGAEREDAAGASADGPARGDSERGRAVFEAECSSCHAAGNAESGFAPGLKGLLERESLPHSGRPATVENVISQLREPVGVMPSYNSLAERDLADLTEYLKTL